MSTCVLIQHSSQLTPLPPPREEVTGVHRHLYLLPINSTDDILEEVKQVVKMSEALKRCVEDVKTTVKKLHHFTLFDGDITKVAGS